MSPSEIVTAFIEAIERKDIAAAAALASPSISYENVPMQPIVGRDAMAATLEMFLANASDDDGLITLWRDYFDLASYQRQLAELTKS
jgi:limonene-1,2-epoxide hydrolase